MEASKERDLIAFLDRIAPHDALYVLGDLFDFWFDFPSPPPVAYQPVLRALERATRRGVRIAIMGGNHDHWIRSRRQPGYLESVIGLEWIRDPHELEVQGLRILLTHGDALGGATGTYRIVRAVLHHRVAIRAFRSLGPRIGYRIARLISASSRSRHDEALQASHAELLRERAFGMLDSGPHQAIVAGHVHIPALERNAEGTYLNLGDWTLHRSYGRLDDQRFSLQRFQP